MAKLNRNRPRRIKVRTYEATSLRMGADNMDIYEGGPATGCVVYLDGCEVAAATDENDAMAVFEAHDGFRAYLREQWEEVKP